MLQNKVLLIRTLLILSVLLALPFVGYFIRFTVLGCVLIFILASMLTSYYKLLETKIIAILSAILISSPFLYTFTKEATTLLVIKIILWLISVVILICAIRTYNKTNRIMKKGA